MTDHTILRRPWEHDVEYLADERAPFQLGTVHVVPRHLFSEPVIPRVAHASGDTPLAVGERSAGSGVVRGAVQISAASALGRLTTSLGSHAVERYLADTFSETVFRALGELLIEESASWYDVELALSGTPVTLELMMEFVIQNLDRHLSVSDIAEVGGCNPTTAERLFSRYKGSAVSACWVHGCGRPPCSCRPVGCE